MTVVYPPGEYYGRSYYAVYFHRPRRHEARSHGVQAAAEATAGGKEISRRRFTAHSLELHSPLLITGRKQWIWAGDRFPTPAGWCFAPRPHAEEHRSGMRVQLLPQPKRAAMRPEA